MIPIAKPNIGEEEMQKVRAVLASGIIAQGEVTKEFEREFAKYIGVKHAIAVSSGTAALCIALKSCKKVNEVVTTPFTFIATSNSILYAGGRPKFVDIEPKTFNMDFEKVKNAEIVIPVHLYGNPCDMDKARELQEAGSIIIEDACQSHGAEFKGKKVGSFGIGCFSFYPTKNMVAGEGGMITTNDDEVAAFARLYLNHGQVNRYEYVTLGFNFRMTDVEAAIGLEQLKKLEGFIAKRRKNASFFSKELEGVENVQTPAEQKGGRHVYNQYTLRVKKRDKFAEILRKNGVGCAVYYPKLVPDSKFYVENGLNSAKCPEAEKACREVISIPVHPLLSDEDLKAIVGAVKSAAKEV